MTDEPSKEELARREEVRRKMQDLLDKRNAIPDAEKTPLHRPERFEDFPIGMDDQGNLYPNQPNQPNQPKQPDGARPDPAKPKPRG